MCACSHISTYMVNVNSLGPRVPPSVTDSIGVLTYQTLLPYNSNPNMEDQMIHLVSVTDWQSVCAWASSLSYAWDILQLFLVAAMLATPIFTHWATESAGWDTSSDTSEEEEKTEEVILPARAALARAGIRLTPAQAEEAWDTYMGLKPQARCAYLECLRTMTS